MDLAIYQRPGGRFIVKPWEGETRLLWAILGPEYTRETAQALAESLEAEAHNRKEVKE